MGTDDEEEIAKRSDAAIKRALNTLPQPKGWREGFVNQVWCSYKRRPHWFEWEPPRLIEEGYLAFFFGTLIV
jgi:hypothetical protein